MTEEQQREVSGLKRAFMKKHDEAMKSFMRWWEMLPENKALKDALNAKCAEHGHEFVQKDVPNPFGYTWKECRFCYERTDIEAPPTPEELDSIKPVGEYRVRIPNIPKKTVRDFGKGPCAKQVVTATLIAANGTRYIATNHCENPQQTCPRGDMPSGQGYELCRDICQQRGHAETNVIELAGENARDGIVYVTGHTYACDSCMAAARSAGVLDIHMGAAPECTL